MTLPSAHAVLHVRGAGFTDPGMAEDIVTFLRWSGCAPQSVDALRPRLAAWIRQLRNRGVESVPHLANVLSPADVFAAHWVTLLMLQAVPPHRRNVRKAHELRDILLPGRHGARGS